MYKSLILLGVMCVVFIDARPKWQILPDVPGYVPVYIRNGDTPLEEINPDLAEAFHALPVGRSVSKELEAAPDTPEQEPSAQDHKVPESSDIIDRRPYEKKLLEKKKKVSSDILKPLERR